MKKLLLVFLAFLPFVSSSQNITNRVFLNHNEPDTVALMVEGQNSKCRQVQLNAIFLYDQVKETITVTLSYKPQDLVPQKYDYLWIPQNSMYYQELKTYFRVRGRRLAIGSLMKKQAAIKGVDVYKLSNSINCTNCTFDDKYLIEKVYGDIENPIDKQLLTLLPDYNLVLKFDVRNKSDNVIIALKNIIPVVNRSGSSTYKRKLQLQYVAESINIGIQLNRNGCLEKEADIQYLSEQIAFFNVQEANLGQIRNDDFKSSDKKNEFDKLKQTLLANYGKMNLVRFNNSGCKEIDFKLDSLRECWFRIDTSDFGRAFTEEEERCYIVRDDINEVNEKIALFNDHYNNLINKINDSSNPEAKSDFINYKEIAIKAIKSVDTEKYKGSLCKELGSSVDSLLKVFLSITNLRFDNASPCGLTANEVYNTTNSMNDIFNEWSMASLSRKSELKKQFNSLVAKMEKRIRALQPQCKNKQLVDAIDEFAGARDELGSLMK